MRYEEIFLYAIIVLPLLEFFFMETLISFVMLHLFACISSNTNILTCEFYFY